MSALISSDRAAISAKCHKLPSAKIRGHARRDQSKADHYSPARGAARRAGAGPMTVAVPELAGRSFRKTPSLVRYGGDMTGRVNGFGMNFAIFIVLYPTAFEAMFSILTAPAPTCLDIKS